MRILFVSCLLPYPAVLHGGGTDLFHLIESLAPRHDVHLVSLVGEDEASHAREIAPYCASMHTVVPAWSWPQKLRSVWRNGWRNPLILGRRAQGLMRAHIRECVATQRIDIVQFDWTETGQYVDAVPPGAPSRILDEVDVSFLPIAYHADRQANPLARWCAQRAARRAETRELALCRRFDAVLTRSEHDRSVLLDRLPHPEVHVLQPWTQVARFADIAPRERCSGRLLFAGAMDRDENCEAIVYFTQTILPRIRARCPNVELHIVGAKPQERIRRLAREPGVVVTGFVADLRPAYAACDVFVAPMQAPGGIFNKIIDAMGAGRPVVTTSLGNEGAGAPIDRAVLVADDPDGFADRTLRLLQDRALWEHIGEGGRRHVQQVYRWEDNVARLEALFERLRSRPRSGGAV
jgi:polysaccharide biosynthesis protein PslH